MFKAIIDLFRIKPVEDSLLAKKVDSMPQPDHVAQEAPSAQAEQIAKAVTTKVAAKKKPRATKTKK
jgi:hypothetical protein